MSYIDVLNEKKADINVFYKTIGDLKIGDLKLPLQVYLPDNFNEKNKYKTIIAIHGGGWHSFKETPVDWDGGWMANTVKYYAKKGYVGIVFSYRDIELYENSDVGDLIKDCRDALEYIATNFPFTDNDNILLMGDSAGGHLALCLGMCLPDNIKPTIKLKGIAVYNPITDCVNGRWKKCSDNAMIYSPVHNIKQIDSRILVMHGTADTLVDIEESRDFTEKMKIAGNDISMMEVLDARHSFILFGYNSTENNVLKVLELTNKYFSL